MRRISHFLEKADQYLRQERQRRLDGQSSDANSLFNASGEVQGEYPPFAAAFGATVLRSGLMPAVFLYAEKSGVGKSRLPLTDLMLHLLRDSEQGQHNQSLLAYAIHHRRIDEQRLRQRLIDASIAAKLALRTFPVADKTKDL